MFTMPKPAVYSAWFSYVSKKPLNRAFLGKNTLPQIFSRQGPLTLTPSITELHNRFDQIVRVVSFLTEIN